MKKQLALDVQGRILERKQEASLKEIDIKNCHRVMLQPPLLPSHLQHPQKKIRIQSDTEITNETSEDIPEISSGNGHIFNCCTRCGHFDIGWHKRVTFLTVFYFRVGMK